MILAQRILDCLRDSGPISARELPKWFSEVDRIDFDTTITRLMRQNSISLTLGRYDLVEQKPGKERVPFIATPVVEPPSAAEEVAASLKPAERTAYCLSCNTSHPESHFPRNGKSGKLYSRCKLSYGAMASKGRQAAKAKREQINGTDHAAGQGVEVVREAGSPQVEVSATTISTPVSSESRNQSDSPAILHTPPPPLGSTEPPATSSAGSPHTGPTQTAEALSPVGAGQSNTSTGATTVSLETPLDKHSPSAADFAPGRTPDSVLLRIEAKREQLSLKIIALSEQFKVDVAALHAQLAELNRVKLAVVALLEEGA